MDKRTLGFLTLLAALTACGDGDDALYAGDDPGATAAEQEVTTRGVEQHVDALEATAPITSRGEKGLGSPIVVMTLNVRTTEAGDTGMHEWKVRKKFVKGMLSRYQPQAVAGLSLLAIQEAYQVSQDDIHTEMLPNFAGYSVDRGDGSMNTIFYRPDRFARLDADFRNVQYRDRDDLCDASVALDQRDHYNRPISFVHLRDLATDLTLYVFAVHFPSKNSCERQQMAKILANYIDDRQDKSANIILLGDFNDGVKPDGTLNDSYRRVIDYTGLRNVFADTQPFNASTEFTTEIKNWNPAGRHGRMIDHILVSPGLLTWTANVDHTLFTLKGGAVPCMNVSSSGFCDSSNIKAKDVFLYSDHFANAAVLF